MVTLSLSIACHLDCHIVDRFPIDFHTVVHGRLLFFTRLVQVKSGTIFDRFLVTDDEAVADAQIEQFKT